MVKVVSLGLSVGLISCKFDLAQRTVTVYVQPPNAITRVEKSSKSSHLSEPLGAIPQSGNILFPVGRCLFETVESTSCNINSHSSKIPISSGSNSSSHDSSALDSSERPTSLENNKLNSNPLDSVSNPLRKRASEQQTSSDETIQESTNQTNVSLNIIDTQETSKAITIIWEVSQSQLIKGFDLFLDESALPPQSGVLTRKIDNRYEYTISNLQPEHQYKIGLRILFSNGQMGQIQTIEASTPGNAPSNLRGGKILPHSIALLWDQDPQADSYQVFIGSELIEQGVLNSKYIFTGLDDDTVYTLGVKAVRENQVSSLATIELRSGRNSPGNGGVFTPPPSISGFSPSRGLVGSVVTIFGSHFNTVNSVKFNGVEATSFTRESDEQLTAIVPESASSGTILLTGSNGSRVSNDVFTPITITNFSSSGAIYSSITITGSGFSEVSSVLFNGQNASNFTVDNDNQITANVPFGASTGVISINHPAGNISTVGDFNVLRYVVSTVAGNGIAGFSDGVGTMAQFSFPRSVTVDSVGSLYISDLFNHRIRKIDTGLNVTTLAGNGIAIFSDGIGTVAQFNQPNGIDLDSAGNIYIADASNRRIRRIDAALNVTTIAGDGTFGSNDGLGTLAKFALPAGLAFDSAGNMYIADSFNHNIRKIDTALNVTTIVGDGTAGFSDGIGTIARFDNPKDLALDSAGNIYVADRFNHRIRKIDTAFNVTTIAGNGTVGFSDGIGTIAQLNNPNDITLDSAGNFYISDTTNQRIRKMTP